MSLDTGLHESEATFEAQFNKAYLDKKGEDEAAKALAEAEHEVILIYLKTYTFQWQDHTKIKNFMDISCYNRIKKFRFNKFFCDYNLLFKTDQ